MAKTFEKCIQNLWKRISLELEGLEKKFNDQICREFSVDFNSVNTFAQKGTIFELELKNKEVGVSRFTCMKDLRFSCRMESVRPPNWPVPWRSHWKSTTLSWWASPPGESRPQRWKIQAPHRILYQGCYLTLKIFYLIQFWVKRKKLELTLLTFWQMTFDRSKFGKTTREFFFKVIIFENFEVILRRCNFWIGWGPGTKFGWGPKRGIV